MTAIPHFPSHEVRMPFSTRIAVGLLALLAGYTRPETAAA